MEVFLQSLDMIVQAFDTVAITGLAPQYHYM